MNDTILGTRGFLSHRVEYLRVGTASAEATSVEGEINREIKIHVYSKRQTSDSS